MQRPTTADTNITLLPDEKAGLPPPVVQRKRFVDDAATIVTVKSFLYEEIDEERVLVPLSAYSFMTGFLNAVCFSAIFAWCASQTGNTIQLSIAVGRLLDDDRAEPDFSFRLSDRLAVCSLVTFLIGGFIGRLGDKIGCNTRLWMTAGTFIQTIFTMAAAIASWKSGAPTFADAGGGPVWRTPLSFTCLGFMSASMGLQGIMAKRLNTQFSTTVVLTTVWCELIAEPKLFNFRRLVVERDHKLMTIAACCAGGLAGRAILDEVGAPVTLGIATGIRMLISAGWLLVPKKLEK
ncbi:hypothetical protein HYDPIDRAFT_29837 [Hydnomerulius pinastri MD-312]|uniref:DUF1275 domain protein n=1 Tax=Hydnomerulius pinastri MD-312 TaxID=994086 RepID=A0A0C9WE96_9AGAM|nr:hypothetical protein HYDPIDRAFT_29837 [Hydnomerulius pinastri MD-312]